MRPYLQSPGCYSGCETRKKLSSRSGCPEMRIQPPWKDLLLQPLARDHVVQLYRDERFLVEAVALFTGIALGKGESEASSNGSSRTATAWTT